MKFCRGDISRERFVIRFLRVAGAFEGAYKLEKEKQTTDQKKCDRGHLNQHRTKAIEEEIEVLAGVDSVTAQLRK